MIRCPTHKPQRIFNPGVRSGASAGFEVSSAHEFHGHGGSAASGGDHAAALRRKAQRQPWEPWSSSGWFGHFQRGL